MARRSANEGTVFQARNGRWTAMLELPRDGNGKRRRALRRARTKAEAQELLRQMQDELRRNGAVADMNRTVAQAVEVFRAGQPPSHHDDWLFGLILAGLGARKVAKLTVGECDDFLAECASGRYGRRPIGPDHLRRVRQRLTAAIRNEIRLGTVSRNVAEVAKLPASEVRPRGRRALTIEELHRLIDHAAPTDIVLIDLCGRNGLRPAEARALRWCYLDHDQGELSITGQMNRHNQRGPVKRAANAERTISIDSVTIDRLSTWRGERARLEADAGPAWRTSDFVVVTALGTPIYRELFANSVRATCGVASIDPPVTPYELRHTAISHQADAGHTSWEIADWAGTSEAMISSRYRHQLRRVAGLTPADRGDNRPSTSHD